MLTTTDELAIQTSPPNIVLADDEELNLLSMRIYLENWGLNCQVYTAGNGTEAHRLTHDTAADLVVLDWEMPEMNGMQTLNRLKSNPETKDIPVIIATGERTSTEHLAAALNAGAFDFLRKPIERTEFLARVKNALGMSRNLKELKLKKEIIREKNEDLTASITYASRIQQGMMPSVAQLREAVPHTLLHYRPKDIVSGDFYWFNIRRKVVTIAVADCTGHGVPGAFVSLIAINTLNQIIREFGKLEVDAILYELHERFSSIIKASGHNSHQMLDGIDIGLCQLNTANRQVTFAGAKRHLILVDNQKTEVIRGAAFEIGGSSVNQPVEYQKHEFVLPKKASLYMMTDGLADQFNHTNDKKFGARRLLALLEDLHQLPLAEQLTTLEDTMNAWRGNTRQTDDQLLIGLKL